MPIDTYRADPRPSQSDLKAYWISPKAGDHQRANPIKATAAMELGTLVHDLVFIGPKSLKKYRLDSPINDKTGKPFGEDSQKYADWKSGIEAEGFIAANAGTIANAQLMAGALSPDARALIAACDHIEEPIFWTADGLDRKGRPDAWKSGEYLLEIKTTSKPLTERALKWEAKSRLYDLQCADYRDGIGGLNASVIIWLSEDHGGDCAVMWLEDDAGWLDGGRKERDRALANYKLSGSGIGCAPNEMRPVYPASDDDSTIDFDEEVKGE